MDFLKDIFQGDLWVKLGVLYLIGIKLLTALRDAIEAVRKELDKTPETDDNAFEKFQTKFSYFVSLAAKVGGSLFTGKRPEPKV